MLRVLALICGVLFSTGGAWAQALVSGVYVSLDGQLEHRFEASGDYSAKAHATGAAVAGVYRREAGVCWATRPDGSKQLGDLMLYIGEVQCCLSVEPISNKFAFTKVWVEGTGLGYQMCKNEVFAWKPD